jgi:DNA-binding NarL/FixJ family response regulator
MNTITILLAEDHTIVREGLRALLKMESDFEIVGEASNGREAVALANTLRPDVIVMDIAMPLLNGMEATRQILQTQPKVKILILSAHNDDAYVNKVMDLGAFGYLIKQSASHILPEAIRRVHQGLKSLSPTVSKRRKEARAKARDRGHLPGKINSTPSTREMEVLQLIAEGKANKETAEILHISYKTVEKHRQSLMEKLNIHDTAGLTRYAISTGVIESSVQVTIV